jgi:DNA-binding NtrC family response regulator
LTEAKDGQEGLNLVLKIPYDVAFVEMVNTKMDGLIGLFKRKAKRGWFNYSSFLMLSAFSENAVEATNGGAFDFITTPDLNRLRYVTPLREK